MPCNFIPRISILYFIGSRKRLIDLRLKWSAMKGKRGSEEMEEEGGLTISEALIPFKSTHTHTPHAPSTTR